MFPAKPLLQAFALLCLVATVGAETPPGLQTLGPDSLTAPPGRDWQRLGIRNWEIRFLERFHRGGGYEAFHIAYRRGKLNLTGILARPYIRDEKTVYPAIILNHGGSDGVSAAYRAIALELARRGYVVLASTYRGQQGAEGRSQGLAELCKGEVIDMLQLTELARQLGWVDSLRMGIIGEGHGAAITMQAIGRSNVFRAAVVISPMLFSGSSEYGFAGMRTLNRLSEQLFGRQLSERELIRELRVRDSFRFVPRIQTPVLLIASDADPNYRDQVRLVSALQKYGIEHRFRRFAGLSPDFMTAFDDGTHRVNWRISRDAAWSEVFSFIEERVPLVVEEEETEDASAPQ